MYIYIYIYIYILGSTWNIFKGHFFTTSYEKIFPENTTIFSNFSYETWKRTPIARSKKGIN